MLQPTDLVAIITHIRIRRTIAHNTDLHLCPGITFRAVQVADGYELMLRKAPMRTIARVRVKTVIANVGRANSSTVIIACAKCLRPARVHLFVDWDSMTAQCRQCVGFNPRVHDMPRGHGNRYIDNYDDDARYRRLMRKKLYADILNFEIAACRVSTPEEFFASRPYLLPEFVAVVRTIDPVLYRKLLYELRRKYMYTLRARKVKGLKPQERSWLDRQIEIRMLNGDKLSKREVKWLQNRLTTARQSSLNCFLTPSLGTKEIVATLRRGSQHGSKQEGSSSRPTVTGSSSSKMSSDQDTNAESVIEWEGPPVINVAEQVNTPGEIKHSNAPNAKDKGL
jgi:hypothetical protein